MYESQPKLRLSNILMISHISRTVNKLHATLTHTAEENFSSPNGARNKSARDGI